MAHQGVKIASLLIMVTVLSAGTARAQSSDCTNVLISLSPCMNYIMGNSSTPPQGCCTQLGSVVRSEPQCLCQVLNGGASAAGLNINQTQAMALPKACNVQTPPVSLCNALSPAGSPAGTPDSPSENTNPTGSGSNNNVPSTGSGSSGATSTKLAAPIVFFLVFVASYASAFTMP